MEDIPSYMIHSSQFKLNLEPNPENYLYQPIYKHNILNKSMFNEYIKAKQLVILNKIQDLKLQTFIELYENPKVSPP